MSLVPPMTRGYAIISAWKFIDSTYDATVRQKVIEQLTPDVEEALGTYEENNFYPAAHWSDVLRGIATIAGRTEANAQHELQTCGTFTAKHASSTALRLLMRIMTPKLFAKKVPSLWARDNTAGRIDVDVSDVDDGRLVFRLVEVDSYPYCGPVAMGWIAFAMKSLGREVSLMKLSGWSLASPAPRQVTIDVELERS